MSRIFLGEKFHDRWRKNYNFDTFDTFVRSHVRVTNQLPFNGIFMGASFSPLHLSSLHLFFSLVIFWLIFWDLKALRISFFTQWTKKREEKIEKKKFQREREKKKLRKKKKREMKKNFRASPNSFMSINQDEEHHLRIERVKDGERNLRERGREREKGRKRKWENSPLEIISKILWRKNLTQSSEKRLQSLEIDQRVIQLFLNLSSLDTLSPSLFTPCE